ncbi:hypothetical protein THRCLA_08067 [Thraustotheca clavata]|uniref:NADPH-dependent FMN reductase-like domain-containing protein n=1 Tax=Thraustotheca clavata TaxID=74557 RepID=A0A1V9ZA84_9STRA|nr:hypothetical protein THRCLA_08067 [Thraustotheca clavata]
MYGALSLDHSTKTKYSFQRMNILLLAITFLSFIGVVYLATEMQSIREQLLVNQPAFKSMRIDNTFAQEMPQNLFSTTQHGNNTTQILIVHAGDAWLKQFGQQVAQGAKSITKNVKILHPSNATINDVLWADALVLGSNVYNANPDPELLAWLATLSFHYDLSSKVASAFVLAGGISAGEELVMTSLLHAALIFQFIVVGGDTWTSAFGASAIMGEGPFHLKTTNNILHGWPNECYRQNNEIPQYFFDKAFGLGRRIAQVATKLKV